MATDVLQMNAIFGRAGKKGLVGGGFRQWFKDFNPTKVSSWLSVTSPITQGDYRDWETDRKSTRLNSSHSAKSRMPSSA